MIKEDVLQYLKDNLYIIQQDGLSVVSNKFYRDTATTKPDKLLNHRDRFIEEQFSKPLASVPLIPQIVHSKATKDIYKLFIEEAKVPSKIENSTGSYWANRYSESGFKAFKKVFDDPKINRPVLLASAKWYYAQTRTARKMIGNYFSDGIWESCYDDFMKAKADRDKRGGINVPLVNIKLPEPRDENASNMEAG